MNLKNAWTYFTPAEKALWAGSVLLIIGSFLLFGGDSWLTLAASLIGVTSLLFNAKANPLGPLLMVLFSALYGVISFRFAYYGEMLTYVGMTGPMSAMALVSWLKNPYQGQRAQVRIARLTKKACLVIALLCAAVTAAFYFILRAFGTANLLPSTASVTTSFLAVALTYRRSALFALAYAANDLVLILLWSLAARSSLSYISVAVCFAVFLVNDSYTYINWRKLQRHQEAQG